MILRRAAVLALFALSAGAATIDEVFPRLHPIDPTAAFAFHQWPQPRGAYDNFGVTFMIWPDRATLILDEKVPLTTQLRKLPQHLPAAKAIRKLRVLRWDFTPEQCGAIPEIFAALSELPAVPVEVPLTAEIPIHGFIDNRQELFIGREHFATTTGWQSHQIALQNVWIQLDACSKHVRGRRVRAR